MSTCIENHIQTLDNNTKKIEKEFNKIKEKI
jgi:chaperonin cofactor prefoldin